VGFDVIDTPSIWNYAALLLWNIVNATSAYEAVEYIPIHLDFEISTYRDHQSEQQSHPSASNHGDRSKQVQA
jgi:hypothetical protein